MTSRREGRHVPRDSGYRRRRLLAYSGGRPFFHGALFLMYIGTGGRVDFCRGGEPAGLRARQTCPFRRRAPAWVCAGLWLFWLLSGLGRSWYGGMGRGCSCTYYCHHCVAVTISVSVGHPDSHGGRVSACGWHGRVIIMPGAAGLMTGGSLDHPDNSHSPRGQLACRRHVSPGLGRRTEAERETGRARVGLSCAGACGLERAADAGSTSTGRPAGTCFCAVRAHYANPILYG